MFTRRNTRFRALLPGLALCTAVTVVASALALAEDRLLGRAWLESLVLAILLGMAVRTLWSPDDSFKPGIAFAAKFLLEAAVVLLGASVSAGALATTGPVLVAGVAAVVMTVLVISYGIGRGLGLSH